MFRRIFLTALLAGFLSGSCISIIHEFTTTPIIFHAETFERKGISKEQIVGIDKSMPLSLSHNHKKMREIKSMVTQPVPYDWERAFLSAISNIITGVGFSLILVACFSLCQAKIGGRQGVVWGMAGFGVVSLAPSLGLPPEIPGVFTANLGPRQMWWFICVGATASGLWMLIFRSGIFWIPFGFILIALPHLIGAPHPIQIGGLVPPEIASKFVSASLVTSAIFWLALGWISGFFWKRFESRT